MKKHYVDNDSGLIERLQPLQATPSRDAGAAERGRARFLAEARAMGPAVSASPVGRLMGWIDQLKAKEISIMNWKVASVSKLAVGAILVAALLGGTVATAYAAQGALPGSPLHSVKTGLEHAQLALSADVAGDARLNLQFAEKRLEELAGLIEAGRFSELADVAAAFEAHIQAAIEGLGSIAQSDPGQAQELATAVTEALSRYASILTGLSASVPTEAQAPLLSALELSTQGVGNEGEDEAEESQDANEDQDLNANEPGELDENECEDGNTNETNDADANENEDLNENDSDDVSQNDNQDLNEKDNEDLDESDHADANENDHPDADENDQEDANEHTNVDVNQSCDPSGIESESGD